jgi:hypothetical protein
VKARPIPMLNHGRATYNCHSKPETMALLPRFKTRNIIYKSYSINENMKQQKYIALGGAMVGAIRVSGEG